MELNFNIAVKGKNWQIPCNDEALLYGAYRRILPEEIVIIMINEIKKIIEKKNLQLSGEIVKLTH